MQVRGGALQARVSRGLEKAGAGVTARLVPTNQEREKLHEKGMRALHMEHGEPPEWPRVMILLPSPTGLIGPRCYRLYLGPLHTLRWVEDSCDQRQRYESSSQAPCG